MRQNHPTAVYGDREAIFLTGPLKEHLGSPLGGPITTGIPGSEWSFFLQTQEGKMS